MDAEINKKRQKQQNNDYFDRTLADKETEAVIFYEYFKGTAMLKGTTEIKPLVLSLSMMTSGLCVS